MPLPNSPNSISLSQIGTEFEDSTPHSISEFYGLGTPPLPASGEFSMSDFHGTSSYEENTWTVAQSGSVSHTLVQDENDFTVSINNSNWSAGDLLIVAAKVDAVSSTAPSGFFEAPSSWVEGVITEDIYDRANLIIVARILSNSDVSGTTFSSSFQYADTSNVTTVNHSFGYGWWRLTKTAGTPGHDSVERKVNKRGISTSIYNSSISVTIPPFTPFDNADSPILVGMTKHDSSTSGWSGLSNYDGMDSNALGHSNSTAKEQNWAAALQTWSNRAQPSNITGYATGHTVAWVMFVTPPT